jgi:hypothetical protein
MITNGLEAQKNELSYDKIIKHTLAQSDEMTVRFINGLFRDNIPLDAPVTWLDKESVNDKHTAFVADFYPKIGERMYSIEIEHDDNGDMAVRVFKYAVGGAILHNMTATDASVNITFPQPCVVFLKNTANTPQSLTWNMEFFDGQKVTLAVPVMRLADLSVEEIARRDLFPIGQFYLRTFEPLTKKKTEDFGKAAAALLTELKNAVESKAMPYHIGVEMQHTIRKVWDKCIERAGEEVDLEMTTNIVETLPWIDYEEVFRKLEERGRAEGKAEGKAERDREFVRTMLARQKQGANPSLLMSVFRDLGISEEVVEEVRKQLGVELNRQRKHREEHER